tara:strand:+ start:16950 stop:17465 length:516 start_codon:yes stop_codon:yes gene_type:complete
MKHLFILLVVLPMFMVAQNQEVYIKLTDAKGTPIKGNATLKGFENSIYALTLATSGNNNSQVNFTMNITGASADLKKAMVNNESLLSGLVTVTQLSSYKAGPDIVYTITMEKIKVQSCNENMGCNNVMTTSITIQPIRIGWTYYQVGKSGTPTVSNKYGFDAETGGSWSKF